MQHSSHEREKDREKKKKTKTKERKSTASPGGDKRDESEYHENDLVSLKEEEDDTFSKSIEDVVIPTKFQYESAEELADNILRAFNADVEDSCFTYSAIPGRALGRVPIECYLLGHKNQVAELADPKGRRVALTFTADPLVTIKSLGTVEKTAPYIEAYGKHILNVPAGYFAKAVSKGIPKLYGSGSHVILDPTFKFTPSDGFVSQIEPYIQHSTIHILRVPAGKVAKVWLGTEPKLLESRREPFVFVDPQFKIVTSKKENEAGKNKGAYFYDATSRYIEHGSIKRIIPHTGEVAITYNNGILVIIHPPKNSKPIIIDSPTHNFDGFISTSLQTILFPSEETKKQTLKDNRHATPDELNLKSFQTRDSLRVGVILVVAFKIKNPEVAITKLGKDGILPHVENIAFADMGKAIQLNTLQEVLYSTQNKAKDVTINNHAPSIQDLVRQNLILDLEDYGIELVRLNIETIKVLDEDIAKKLAGQSVTSAEFTTKQATLVKEYDIKTTEARLRAETDNIIVQQKNQAVISQAQARLEAARIEAEALIVTSQAQQSAAEMSGALYRRFPKLLELELLKIKSSPLKKATVFMTPDNLSLYVNSPGVFTNLLLDPSTQTTTPQNPTTPQNIF